MVGGFCLMSAAVMLIAFQVFYLDKRVRALEDEDATPSPPEPDEGEPIR